MRTCGTHALALAGVCMLFIGGCGDSGGGGGGNDGPRIGRGVEQPTGQTVTLTFQEGTAGYAGGDDYCTGSSPGANLLAVERNGTGVNIGATCKPP